MTGNPKGQYKPKAMKPKPRKRSIASMGLGAFLAVSSAIGAPVTLSQEGMSLKPYYDSVGVQTVCGGETNVEMRTYTRDECVKMYEVSYGWYSARTATMYNETGKAIVTPEMHAAFTDMSYNVGAATVKKSSMVAFANAGKPREACDAILRYKKAGKVLDCSKTKGWTAAQGGCYGIWERRVKIHKLCLKGV